jgi:hypothetical protein
VGVFCEVSPHDQEEDRRWQLALKKSNVRSKSMVVQLFEIPNNICCKHKRYYSIRRMPNRSNAWNSKTQNANGAVALIINNGITLKSFDEFADKQFSFSVECGQSLI